MYFEIFGIYLNIFSICIFEYIYYMNVLKVTDMHFFSTECPGGKSLSEINFVSFLVLRTARCDHQRTLQKTEFKTPNNTHTQNNLRKPTTVSTTPRHP